METTLAAPTARDGEAAKTHAASETPEHEPQPPATSGPEDGLAQLAAACDVPVKWLAELGVGDGPAGRLFRRYGTGKVRCILQGPLTGDPAGSQHWPAKKHNTGSRKSTFGVQSYGWLEGREKPEVLIGEGIKDHITARRWAESTDGAPAILDVPGITYLPDVLTAIAEHVSLIVLCLDNDKDTRAGQKARERAVEQWRQMPAEKRPLLGWITALEATGTKDITEYRELFGWQALDDLFGAYTLAEEAEGAEPAQATGCANAPPAMPTMPTMPDHKPGRCAWCGKKLPKKQRKTRRWCGADCKAQYGAQERVLQKFYAARAALQERLADTALVLPDTKEGLEEALDAHGVSLRWNLRSNTVEVLDVRHQKDWERLAELHEARLQTDIWEACLTPENMQWQQNPDRWARHLKSSLFDKQLDPFVDWLEALIADPAVPVLPADTGPLTGCFSIPKLPDLEISDQEWAAYVSWVERQPFDSAIALAHNVPRSGQIATVLQSPQQGIGKSSTFAESFPPEHRRHWFVDNYQWTSSDADAAGISGAFVECQEMGAMSKAGRDTVKARLSSEFTQVRFPYDRRFTEIRRRTVIVCTDNRRRCLPADETGNRRFAPLPVYGTPHDISPVLRWWHQHRLAWWKTRALAVQQGQGVWLCPPELRYVWDRVVDEFRWQHHDEQAALDWLENHGCPPEMSTDEVIAAAGIREHDKITAEDRKNVAKALRSLGYEEHRPQRDGRRVRVWVKPQEVAKCTTGAQASYRDPGERDTAHHTLRVPEQQGKLGRAPTDHLATALSSDATETRRLAEDF